jgi:hypothetical protein
MKKQRVSVKKVEKSAADKKHDAGKGKNWEGSKADMKGDKKMAKKK